MGPPPHWYMGAVFKIFIVKWYHAIVSSIFKVTS